MNYRIYKIVQGSYEIYLDTGDADIGRPPTIWALTRQGVLDFFEQKHLEAHGQDAAVWDAILVDVEKCLEESPNGFKGMIQV